jgi:tetratricopeptide (TPR) repeat protein
MRSLVILTFLLSIISAPAEEPDLSAHLESGETYLSRWQIGEASQSADRALELAKNNEDRASAYFLKSQVEFFKGNYAQAKKFAEEAYSQNPKGKKIGNFLDYISRVSEVGGEFKEVRTERFLLRYGHAKDSILLGYAEDVLNKAYYEIGLDLEAYPGEPVIVEIYPDLKSFTLASTLSEKDIKTTGVVGICKFNRIMILSPRLLPQGYSWFDTLAHEYTHYLIFLKSGNTVPVWLHEGIAKFQERRWKEKKRKVINPFYETLLATAVKEDSLVPIGKMHPSLGKLDSAYEAQLAFAQVGTIVDFLVRKWGSQSLVDLLDIIREKEDLGLAIKEVTNMSFDDFYGLWVEDLRGKNLNVRIPGLKVKELRFKQEKTRPQDQSEDLVDLDDARAREYTRLGDLLSIRERVKAAAYEYEKALHFDRYSPIIINRLASVQISQGEYDEAKKRLSASLELYPEYVDTHVNLGRIYLNQGNLNEAEKAYREAIAINPFNPEIHIALASIYNKLGLTDLEEREKDILATLLKDEPRIDTNGHE